MYLNIRSLKANYANLEVFIDRLKIKPLIIVCAETLNLDCYHYYKLTGYKIYYNNSRLNKADGVVIYIKDNMVEDTNIIEIGKLRILNTKIKTGDNTNYIEISAIYRSHDLSKLEFIANLKTFIKNCKNIRNHCIVGDFNINILENNEVNMEFINNFLEKGYTPCFTNITRPLEKDGKGTCIDNIFVKTDFLKYKSFTLLQTITDHYPLLLKFEKLEIQKDKNKQQTLFNINYTKLKNIAANKNWNLLKSINDSNSAVDSLINEIQICINMATSNKIISKNKSNRIPRKNWITKAIINSCKNKEDLYLFWKKNPGNYLAEKEYKNFKKILDKVIKDAKIKFDEKLFDSKCSELKNVGIM